MWRASLSPVKVLFLIVRYYSFVHTAFTVNYFRRRSFFSREIGSTLSAMQIMVLSRGTETTVRSPSKFALVRILQKIETKPLIPRPFSRLVVDTALVL